jgi:hypothetical protein
MDDVVAALLHNNVPVVPVAVSTEFTAIIRYNNRWSRNAELTGAATPLAAALVQPLMV